MRTLLVLSVIGFVTFFGWQAYLDSEKGSVSKLSQIDENARSEIPSRPLITSHSDSSAMSQASSKQDQVVESLNKENGAPKRIIPKRIVQKKGKAVLKQQQIKQNFLPTEANITSDLSSKKNPKSYDQFVKIEKQWVQTAEGRIKDVLTAKNQPCAGYSAFCERVRKGHDVQVVGLSIDSARVASRHHKVIQGDLNKGHYIESTPALYLD